MITSWSHLAGANPPILKLKVGRPLGGDSFRIVGDSPFKTPVPGQLSTYTDVRIPVAAGDVIGAYYDTDGLCGLSVAGYGFHRAAGDPPAGNTVTLGSFTGLQLDISATLEPDADGDGFGDETQDGCPTDATKQLDCYPPETQITKGPKDKTKKKQVTFEFSADDPGASFECSLDGAGFEACVSPLIHKVGKGKHSFQVRARDAAGNVDGSPATDSWKVKKKKKKK